MTVESGAGGTERGALRVMASEEANDDEGKTREQTLRAAEAELRARLAQQEAIATLGQQALRATELATLLDEVVASVARTLDVEYCKVLELEPDGKALLLRSGVGWKEGLVGQATVSAGLDSQAGYTLSTRQVVIVEDLGAETRFSGPLLLREHGVTSGVSTVIGNPDHPWGVLGAHTRSKRRFTHDDANFIQAAGNIVTAAVERLGSEQALRLAQTYTRGLIEASVDAMLTIDKDLVITDVNEQMAKLTEMPKTMLIGSRFDACFTDPERAAAGVRKTLSEGVVTNYDLALRAAGGRELLVSFNASIFYDELGKARGVFAVARDVTEQRRTEEQLREQQNYSRGLIESSVDALFAIDPDLRITDVNEQTVQFTGYSRAELTSGSFPSLFTEPERAVEGVRTALAAGSVKDYELTVRAADGRELPVSFNASTFRDAAGNIRGVFAAARDIAERRRLERERSLLAAIVESSNDAIYSTTPETIVTSWNRGAERLYGFSAQEMIGRSFAVCVPFEQRAEFIERLKRSVKGKTLEQFDTVRRRKDGGLIDVSLTEAPILDKAGSASGIAMSARDITERKRLDRELTRARDVALEAARTRSEFFANMSHEIRTPLTSVMGMTQMLLDTELSEHQKEYARAAQRGGEALLSIINDILDFSKIAAGKPVLEQIDLELESTVGSALDMVARQAQAKGLEVAVAFEADVPRLLRGDPGRLRQVLANLLSNAVKFTERGEIVVRASKLAESPDEATLRFEVRDSGIGIPKDKQGRLFQAFSQVDSSDSREHGGTGLGLAISRGLVERMGGTIGLSSEPGVGSTFWFTAKFPKQDALASKPSRAITSLEGVRALVVDDNATSREILEHQLSAWNMATATAPGPEEALRILRAHVRQKVPFKIALLDMDMPIMDGVELARRIRAEPEIAATDLMILSSMDTRPQNQVRADGLGLKGWLLKPVRPSELYQALAEALARGALAHSAAAVRTPGEMDSLSAAAALEVRERKLRALIVEDNATNRQVARWHLEKLGFSARAVASGGEALEALAQGPYDVVLMDCRMPKLDGYETTRRIRQREGAARHTKIVAMTAHALEGDREKCLSAGMDDYVSKPICMDNMIGVLDRVLGLRAGASAAQTPALEAAPALSASPPAVVGLNAPATATSSAGGLEARRDGPQRDGGPQQREEKTLDAATMESLRAKRDLLRNLIRIFLKEAPEQLAQLAEVLEKRDKENAAIIAHSLKGAAATFGAMRMRELAESVERASDGGEFEAAQTSLEALRAECERVRRALEAEPAAQSS